MATRKEKQLIKRKTAITYAIRNIKSDYSGVLPEDIPAEVTAEIAELFNELHAIRAEIDLENA
jgi:hypothetical protein